ncbi:response regulator [Desulfosarcina sp.]|uniref:response regulator n=1 Tax=Desulfosarcina sp. TaxID=2027861 RepID=UPI003563A811
MTRLLFVTPDRSNFADLSSEFKKQGGTILWAASGDQALKAIEKQTVDLVVTDERLGDMTGLELIGRLVTVNPMINCAAVSSLSKEAYHEASEGLGMLMQLPPRPSQADGERLMARLNQILRLNAPER